MGWSGTSKGRKAIQTEMEKQMFGKAVFAVPGRRDGTQSGLRSLRVPLPTPGPYSLLTSLVSAPFP